MAAGAALALLTAACSSEQAARPPAANVSQPPSPPAATAPATEGATESDQQAKPNRRSPGRRVPQRIDKAYVQQVIDDLDDRIGAMVGVAARQQRFGERFRASLSSLYTSAQASEQLGAWQSVGVKRLAKRPKGPETRVRDVISASRHCVFFSAHRDYSPALTKPIEVRQPYYVALQRAKPSRLNSRPWVMSLDTFYRDGSTPEDPCA